MSIDLVTLLTIIGMAVVAMLSRASGFWLFARAKPSARFESALKYMTPAILIAIVVPEMAHGGLPTWLAGLATLIVAARTRQVLPALIVGVAIAALLRGPLG